MKTYVKLLAGCGGKKGKEERCLHVTSLIFLFTHLFIFIIKFHVGEFWIQESGKTTQKKSHCILTVYFPKKTPCSLLASKKDSHIMKNRKLNPQDNTAEVQMKRFCSDIMLQPGVQIKSLFLHAVLKSIRSLLRKQVSQHEPEQTRGSCNSRIVLY